MIIKHQKIKIFTTKFLTKLGLKKSQSRTIADLLVKSDMCKHYSHGINRLFQYYESVNNKIIKIKSKPIIKKTTSNFTLIDGKHAFGQLVMSYACKNIISNAKDIKITAVINAGHIGRLSDYNEILAKKNLISLIFCNGGGPNTSIFPSRERIVGTNPFSFGIPISKDKNLIIDFATSKLAEGKIKIAALEKKKIKNLPIISNLGKATNNPNALFKGGALLPFGEIKGSAFLLVNEILGGLLISRNNPINNNYVDGNNCMIISLNKRLFNYNKDFLNQFKKLNDKIKKSKKLKYLNNKKTYLPGELEAYNLRISKRLGIKYHNKLISGLNNLAKNKLNFGEKDLITQIRN